MNACTLARYERDVSIYNIHDEFHNKPPTYKHQMYINDLFFSISNISLITQIPAREWNNAHHNYHFTTIIHT